MKCPACRLEAPEDANFCPACGTPLVRTCTACGTELPGGALFCKRCGRSISHISSDSAATVEVSETDSPHHLLGATFAPQNPLEDERRILTVLFADLKGSMELLAAQDAEDGRKILDRVLQYMIEAVHRYDGRVTQVMGDGIMALFGAPSAHENHGLQACCAAMAMQQSVARYNLEVEGRQGPPVWIRVGLNTGEAVVHPIGVESELGLIGYTAVGRSVHIAARMEQAAAPGSVLLTSQTLQLVDGFVDVEHIGRITLKGLAEPADAYKLTGIRRAQTRLEVAAARGLTPFTGRDSEMRELSSALERAGGGHGQVVSIIGEAGLGKSRLLLEFIRSPCTEGWWVLETSSAYYDKGPPGAPVIDLLRKYLRLPAHVEREGIRDHVTTRVLGLDPSFAPLVTPLLTLLDAPVGDPEWNSLDPPQRLRRSLQAFLQLLIRESRVRPLLVVVDDLQPSDSVTQSFLETIINNLANSRIMLLVSHRPSYQHHWESKTYYRQLRLDPLREESANAMLDALVGRNPELVPLRQLLIARTEGNPFFVEESVRSLVETGVLAGSRGHYHPVTGARTIQLPASVEAVLATRIDRLAPNEKRLLQIAAVVGRDVPMALLRTIADMDENALCQSLAELQASEFLYATRLPPSAEYTFKHALTHHVAYSRMLLERRRVLHRQIAEVIEITQPDPDTEKVELLAHHAFRGEMWDTAVRYLRQAGITAASRPAHQEAVVRFEQSLDAVQHLPESRQRTELAIDITFDLRNSLQALGKLSRLLDYIRQTQAQAELIGDGRRLAQASAFACQYYRLTGDIGNAIEAGERAVAIADQLGDPQLVIATRAFLGPALAAGGDHRRATEVLASAVKRLRGDQVHDAMGTTGILSVFLRIYLATSLAEQGDFSTAVLYAEPAYRTAEAVGHVYSMTFGCYGIGTIRVLRGEIEESIAILERGLELCRSWNLPVALPLLGASLGHAYCLAGRPQEAIRLLEEAELQAGAMGRMGGHAILLVRLGEAYAQAGRIADAHLCADRALTLSQKNQERAFEAYSLRLLGDLGRDDASSLEDSETFYHRAAALAEQLQMRPLLAHCYFDLYRLFRRAGLRANADTHLKMVIELFQALDMPYWLERARASQSVIASRASAEEV
jgi:class 3 adenylate cyclase/tetratricopeptide (TPR) repeat protein